MSKVLPLASIDRPIYGIKPERLKQFLTKLCVGEVLVREIDSYMFVADSESVLAFGVNEDFTLLQDLTVAEGQAYLEQLPNEISDDYLRSLGFVEDVLFIFDNE